MSANGAVWGRVRSRLRAFPERLAACGAEAAAYGRCVQASTAPGGRLSKDLCAREFQALRSCFAAAVGGRGPLRALLLQEPAGPGRPLLPRGSEFEPPLRALDPG
ncbi:NADH dehydrogenase [ubiquinone] 1 alpha subcomplex assembly factor 8 isoform X1 [Callithrix jacchus]